MVLKKTTISVTDRMKNKLTSIIDLKVKLNLEVQEDHSVPLVQELHPQNWKTELISDRR